MSKCDTMRCGETLRLQHRETDEVITVTVRTIEQGRVKVSTEADQRWIIAKLPVGGVEKA